jgi:hypothetical protein
MHTTELAETVFVEELENKIVGIVSHVFQLKVIQAGVMPNADEVHTPTSGEAGGSNLDGLAYNINGEYSSIC